MRQEFTAATRKAAWERCQGLCEVCGQPILPHRPHYHHVVEAALGGGNDLDNCMVLHPKCHAVITAETSAPRLARVARIWNKARNIIKRKRPWLKGRKFGQ